MTVLSPRLDTLMQAFGHAPLINVFLHEAGQSLCITDAEHIIVHCGQQCAALLGYHPQDLLGRCYDSLLPVADMAPAECAAPTSLLHKDGEVIEVTGQCRPLRHADGHLCGLLYQIHQRAAWPLDARSQLLEESNHRVRNNLAMICALLDMEMVQAPPQEKRRLQVCLARTRSLALVYNYAQHSDSLIDIGLLARATIDNVRALYEHAKDPAPILCKQSLSLVMKRATYLSLALTEIMVFFLSQEHLDDDPGLPDIAIEESAGQVRIIVENSTEWPDRRATPRLPSISRELIAGMVERSLGGKVQIEETPAFRAVITFPLSPSE